MQVIPENLNITTGYHVFETPDDIIINSQIYDKITMEPKPYNFFNTNYCLNNKNLLLHEVNILEYPWAKTIKEHDYKYYLQDSKNNNIFYCVTETGLNNQNQCILKLEKTNTGWKILNNVSPDSGYRFGSGVYAKTNSLHYKIIGQTDDFVVFIGFMNGADYLRNGNTPRMLTLTYISINKSTMEIKYLNVGYYNDYGIYTIKENNDSIYLFEHLAGRLRISKFDPYSNTRNCIYINDTSIDTNCIGISNIIEFRDKYYILTSNNNTNDLYYAFLELTIDFTYNIITEKLIEIEKDNNFPYHNGNGRTDLLNCSWLQIDLKNIDNKYISITVHDNENKIHGYAYHWRDNDYDNNNANPWQNLGQTLLSQLKYHRHILYKYDNSTDKFISKGIIIPDDEKQHIYGVIYYNQYIPVFFTNKNIMAYRLNLETEKYEKVFEKTGTFYTIGLDEANNFYIFDSNNHCSIYNKNTSCELIAEFEQENYDYEDTNIDTYITVYSKNFLGEYINSKVQITLTGNCYFKENNSKELVIITEKEIQQIPVIITNGGTVYCYIKEVE